MQSACCLLCSGYASRLVYQLPSLESVASARTIFFLTFSVTQQEIIQFTCHAPAKAVVAIGNPEQHMCKASHCGSKQQ